MFRCVFRAAAELNGCLNINKDTGNIVQRITKSYMNVKKCAILYSGRTNLCRAGLVFR